MVEVKDLILVNLKTIFYRKKFHVTSQIKHLNYVNICNI